MSHFIYHNDNSNKIKDFIELSKLPGTVKSVSFYEDRFIEYKDYSTTFFPTMKKIDYMDIVYE